MIQRDCNGKLMFTLGGVSGISLASIATGIGLFIALSKFAGVMSPGELAEFTRANKAAVARNETRINAIEAALLALPKREDIVALTYELKIVSTKWESFELRLNALEKSRKDGG